MKRLFAAIEINPDEVFLDQFRMLKAQFRHEKIKWVEEHNIHITLKFLGNTDESLIPRIDGVLKELAADTKAFSFSLKNLGIFGSSYDPKVIWAGIEPFAELAGIMKEFQGRLNAIGYEPDRQNPVPHLTLGRIKYLHDKLLFQQIIDQNKNIASGEIKVDRFFLYKSILKKEGPIYVALQTYTMLR